MRALTAAVALSIAATSSPALSEKNLFTFNTPAIGYKQTTDIQPGEFSFSSKTCTLKLNGFILPELVRQFDRAIYAVHDTGLAHCKVPRALELSSSGGSIFIAIQLAGRIASLGMTTHVPKGTRCASACIFLWAAGTVRTADGTLSVHRASRRGFDGYTAHGDMDAAYLDYFHAWSTMLLTTFDVTPEFVSMVTTAPRSRGLPVPAEIVAANRFRARSVCSVMRDEKERDECATSFVRRAQADAILQYRTFLEIKRLKWYWDDDKYGFDRK